jgi:hypothetical protein
MKLDRLAAFADPKDEQHEEMKEWVSGAWDATRFSLEQTNAGLKRIKAPSGFPKN